MIPEVVQKAVVDAQPVCHTETVEAWINYQNLLLSVPFILVPVPERFPALPPVNVKDVHVVAAAVEVGAAYLLTLDKGLLTEANRAKLAFSTLTPGDFIKTILPTHIEYPTFS